MNLTTATSEPEREATSGPFLAAEACLGAGGCGAASPWRPCAFASLVKKRKNSCASIVPSPEASIAAKAPPPPAKADVATMAPDELLKEQKKLKKKLKQVEELETKVAGGLAPSAEQREKLARKSALADELAAVEARL